MKAALRGSEECLKTAQTAPHHPALFQMPNQELVEELQAVCQGQNLKSSQQLATTSSLQYAR